MESSQIIALLREQFGTAILESFSGGLHPRVHIAAEHWAAIAEYLYSDPRLRMDWLGCLSGVDYAADDKLCVVYELQSFELKHALAVKVFCPRAAALIPSVVRFWPTANWHEREAFDLLGIEFAGHPDLRRILCAEDWVGYPLRKDYVFPREYHGIPGSVELDWQQKPH